MVKDVRKELTKTANHFMQCVRKKNWLGAKADYDNARTVAVYMKIPEENMVELFGDLENGIDGLFPYDLVQETFFQTVVKNSLEWRNRSFEEFRRGLQAGTLNLKRWQQG